MGLTSCLLALEMSRPLTKDARAHIFGCPRFQSYLIVPLSAPFSPSHALLARLASFSALDEGSRFRRRLDDMRVVRLTAGLREGHIDDEDKGDVLLLH
jgi:hypothetical protein